MARADGVCYWDVHGKRYLDALSGIYVVSVGHNNRRVIDAIRKQLDERCFSPPMHGTNPVAVQLANLLAELAPGDLDAVKFQCGGSEVTEAAIKLARQYHRLTGSPGKYKVHQPLPVVARLDARRAVGVRPEVAQDRQRAAGPRLPPRLSADLLPLPVRQELPRLRHHLRHARRRA